MPSSLPPLPDEIGQRSKAPDSGSAPNSTSSAFSGGMPPMMQSLQQIETGLKQLATQVPSLLPMCAQMISQLRMAVPDAMSGAAAGASPSGGPTGPAISGMGQNPTALPAPPPQGP